MNRFFKILLCFTLLFLTVSSFAFAEDEIRIRFDGEFVDVDASPVIVDGRTLVPLRDVFELFDFEVGWESDTYTALGSKGGFEIRMPINSMTASVAGIEFELDVPAQLINGKTYIPVRFVSEHIGAEVRWNDLRRYVDILLTPLNEKVRFKDPNFENLLKSLVNVDEEEDILVSDLRYIIELNINDSKISRIDGIEHMAYLQELIASNNSITDLTAIKDLIYLKHLNLDNNLVKDSDDFVNLKNVSYLNLRDNNLNDTYGLEDLYRLKELYLSGNDLGDLGRNALYYFDSSVIKDLSFDIDDEPDYNTWNLRHQTDYEIEVADGVYWVPANQLGLSTILNEDLLDLSKNTPQGIQSHIDTLYELFQYLAKTDYKFINDDKSNIDESKRLWQYHKNPLKTLESLYGSEKSLAIGTAYILKRDYFARGVFVMITDDGSHDYINYIYDNHNYYVYYPSQYLKSSYKNSAREDGFIETYNNSGKLNANVHKIENLMDFANAKYGDSIVAAYRIDVFDDEKALYPEGTYDDSRQVTGTYYFLPVDSDDENYWTQRMEILFDKTDDDIRLKWAPLELSNPVWK